MALLTLHTSALEVGGLVAAPMIGYLVIGLPAGIWVDRYPKRRIMIVADLVRAAALMVVPLSAAVGVLALWQLYRAAGVTGFASVLFTVSSQSVLPAPVGPVDLAEANVRMGLPSGVVEIHWRSSGCVCSRAGGWESGLRESASMAIRNSASEVGSSARPVHSAISRAASPWLDPFRLA